MLKVPKDLGYVMACVGAAMLMIILGEFIVGWSGNLANGGRALPYVIGLFLGVAGWASIGIMAGAALGVVPVPEVAIRRLSRCLVATVVFFAALQIVESLPGTHFATNLARTLPTLGRDYFNAFVCFGMLRIAGR